MKILYGTSNPAKLESMKRITEPLGIELISLKDLDRPVPVIEENGSDPLENAAIKAKAYYKAFHIPVFSCDSGLYFEGVEKSLQPGTHVRRVKGKELSDDEMTEYYSDLASRYEGGLTARYRNAICFVVNEECVFQSMDDSLSGEPFLLVSVPHEKKNPGFPLDCLSMDLKTGKYYYDMPDEPSEDSLDKGFASFFRKCLHQMRDI